MSGISIRLDGLQDVVERIVDERLAQALGHQTAEDPWYSSAAAAEYMGVTVQRVHDLLCAGLLPRYGEKGERIFLRRSDCDRYMETRGRS